MNGSFKVINYSEELISAFGDAPAFIKPVLVTRRVFFPLSQDKAFKGAGLFCKKNALFYKKIVRFEL